MAAPIPEAAVSMDLPQDWMASRSGEWAELLARDALPGFLPQQRWYAAKDKQLAAATLNPWMTLKGPEEDYLLAAVDLSFTDGSNQSYLLPLGAAPQAGAPVKTDKRGIVARARLDGRQATLRDVAAEPGFALALLRYLQSGAQQGDALKLDATPALRELALPPAHECRRPTAEQSNVSLVLGDALLLKIYRRLRPGVQPEIEVSRFLTEAGFRNTPPYLGALDYVPAGGVPVPIAAAFGFVANDGNAWDGLLPILAEELSRNGDARLDSPSLRLVRTIGARTAEMHCAFATPTRDPAFAVEPVTPRDIEVWVGHALRQAEEAMAACRGAPAADLAAQKEEIARRIEAYRTKTPGGSKMRHHGDYHLGQVLVGEGDVYIIDFEGEPLRSLEERRAKTDPARDLAGMLRSFDYLAAAAVKGIDAADAALAARAATWREAAERVYLEANAAALSACDHWPDAPAGRHPRLGLFLLEKVLYEISYEAANRPEWISIPLAGLSRLLADKSSASS